MRGRRIPLALLPAPSASVMRRQIVRVRLAEVLVLAPAIDSGQAKALHDLRIACKRLRYALELHRGALPPEAERAERTLAALQDLLGEIHDCDVLRSISAKGDAGGVARIIARDRRTLLARARRLWREAFGDDGALSELAPYAGLSSPQGAAGAAP
ncbi:MAG: CHAD domain-containing protein [bacterium]|nr:CHAD domain-containing protein [bacterium]